MAKQRGIFRASGKIEGRSFYYSRLGGALSRSIDPNLSERVKRDPAYAVLRAKAKEFGQAGKLAGVILGSQSNYWRYIYRTMAAGKLARFVYQLIQQDETHPLGLRIVPTTQFNTLRQLINSLSKNNPPLAVVDIAKAMIVSEDGNEVSMANSVKLGQSLADQLNAWRANSFTLDIWAIGYSNSKVIDDSYADGLPRAEHPVRIFTESHSSDKWDANDTLCSAFTAVLRVGRYTLPLQDDGDGMYGALLVLSPRYNHGGGSDILQRSCSALWAQIDRLG